MIVILTMLLLVYRSVVTVALVLVMVMIELAASRGIVAFLSYYDLIGLSTFAVNLLTMLAIAAGTDYAIFLIGRYHEARNDGADRETAFYTMYRGTAHVILGSGLTIAGATFCLRFCRLPYFQTLGIPLAIGMLVAVLDHSQFRTPSHRWCFGSWDLFGPEISYRPATGMVERCSAAVAPDRRRLMPLHGLRFHRSSGGM